MNFALLKLLAAALSVALILPTALAVLPGSKPPAGSVPPIKLGEYNRAFYNLLELDGDWVRDSDAKRGNTIFVPTGKDPRTAVLADTDGHTTRITVPAGGCLLETRHFLAVSDVRYDLQKLGDSGAGSCGSGMWAPYLYGPGQWTGTSRSGCASAVAWDASSNCYLSTCGSGQACTVNVSQPAGGGGPGVHTTASCDGTTVLYKICGTFLEAHF